jgi:hypothetical protein
MSREDMAREIEGFADDEIILSEDQEGINGFLVFVFKEDYLLIKTFNLKRFNHFSIIKTLFLQMLKFLEEHKVEKIRSEAHHTNKKSINFHLGMGFKAIKTKDQSIEYECSKKELIERIKSRLIYRDKIR